MKNITKSKQEKKIIVNLGSYDSYFSRIPTIDNSKGGEIINQLICSLAKDIYFDVDNYFSQRLN